MDTEVKLRWFFIRWFDIPHRYVADTGDADFRCGICYRFEDLPHNGPK